MSEQHLPKVETPAWAHDLISLASLYRLDRNRNARGVYFALLGAASTGSLNTGPNPTTITVEELTRRLEISKDRYSKYLDTVAYRDVIDSYHSILTDVVVPETVALTQPRVYYVESDDKDSCTLGSLLAALNDTNELYMLMESTSYLTGEWKTLAQLVGAYDRRLPQPERGLITWARTMENGGFNFQNNLASVMRGCWR